MKNTRNALKKGRHLVLIDIENLLQTPEEPSLQDAEAVVAVLRDAVPEYDDAHQVVACSHHTAASVAFAFRSARHLWRSGRNGADLALLDVLENERVDERFEYVTICSGDGIFADAAGRLGGADVDVTAISHEDRLSAKLRLAVRHVVYLTPAAAHTGTGSAS